MVNQGSSNYDVGSQIIYNTEILKPNLCDYNNAYILVRDNITTIGCNLATEEAIINYAPCTQSLRVKLMKQQ